MAASIAETGVETLGLGFDTSNEEQVAAAMQKVVDKFGRIDILHNNAAITSVDFMMRDGMVHELDVDLWDQTMAVNVRGYMLCAKHAIGPMLSKRRRRDRQHVVGRGPAGRARARRVRHLEDRHHRLHEERRDAVREDGHPLRLRRAGHDDDPTIAQNVPPPLLDIMRRHTLTPDLAKPEDVANAVVFLASPRAAFITGIAMPVDGGFGIHGPSYADEVAMWSGAAERRGRGDSREVPRRARGARPSADGDATALDDARRRRRGMARRRERQGRDRRPLERAGAERRRSRGRRRRVRRTGTTSSACSRSRPARGRSRSGRPRSST